MSDSEVLDKRGITVDLAKKIVADAIRLGYLTDLCSGGCGKTYDSCGGCPCGSSLGWHPKIQKLSIN
jgi:hypothetical protein